MAYQVHTSLKSLKLSQLFWWILAASAPIFGIVSATLAMYEIDKPDSQKEIEIQ
ncbi:MAG: hypothetical protein ACKO7D_09695 [Bacteroidota bacterium]